MSRTHPIVPASSALPVPAPTAGASAGGAERVPSLRREIRGTFWAGIAIVALFFGAGGVWATTAPMSGAIIAHGVVSPEGSRRTVQHLEGGIIREFQVKEGSAVKAGDPLLVLADVNAQAEVGTLMTRLRTVAATEARLSAERFGAKQPVFAHPSLADLADGEVRAAIEQQINAFETRRDADQNRTDILTQRIAQLDQQTIGAQRQIEGIRRQLVLIREEIVAKQDLFEKGYETKPRLLALQREEAQLVGNEGELLSRIARNHEAIGETKLQINSMLTQRREEIDRELAEAQAKRSELEAQIEASLDKLSRTNIVAPVDGTVISLHFKTVGGVVRPGEPILDIVPIEDDLIIDARIRPLDIDDVRVSAEATVMFPSYPQRQMIRVPATVQRMSADVLTDSRTGEPYFNAKIVVDRGKLKELDPFIELTPGLPAEVYISTVERTFFEYIMQPFLFAVERAFREH
ncbi:MAG: HlyD family type I secretion periplasmic adaptor subunit [Rhodospirillales bacterium]|nr:HlyD family type I secretion periplasmic adaptor subunit [Rhodospirillales bacterium]